MNEINDELMMPCPQCCKKHLSAAIAHYADSTDMTNVSYWRVVFARAMINLCEATEGYESHRAYARGLFVKSECECPDPDLRKCVRDFRLSMDGGEWIAIPPSVYPSEAEWSMAHVIEAEREFPDIRFAVARKPFYRDNMSEPERRQAEINYRLAQLKWLDENVFGVNPVEKGDK